MALPTALFAMIASMALASAAVVASVDVQQGTTRDHGSKEAIAAADAGANVALLRLNRFQSKLSAATPCVGPARRNPALLGWLVPGHDSRKRRGRDLHLPGQRLRRHRRPTASSPSGPRAR